MILNSEQHCDASLVKNRRVNNLHHEVLQRVLVENVRDELKPIRLALAINRGVAEIPKLRVPARQIPVDKGDFEVAASVLSESIPFNHDVLWLKISMGENNPVAFEGAIDHFSHQRNIVW